MQPAAFFHTSVHGFHQDEEYVWTHSSSKLSVMSPLLADKATCLAGAFLTSLRAVNNSPIDGTTARERD